MDESSSRVESPGGTEPGQVIGSYRVLQPLSSGGMSSVFRAVHVETGHEVALKVLSRTLARNATLLQRFLREARSAETLEHPNIVTIYDRGIDRGRHYLVLEYVSGGDLHEYVRRGGPLGVAEASVVIKDVARALKYAAGCGLIHRDIKPSNILRTKTGQIKLIDLGLALQSNNEDERVTREGTTVGTVDYMAPEQARDSRATSIQSDLYSLGCTFYFLLTGVSPYPGGDITEKLIRHAKADIPDVRDLRDDVPPKVASIIMKMMAKRPEDRFASYDDLIDALAETPAKSSEERQGLLVLPLDGKADESTEIPGDVERNAQSFGADRPESPYGLTSIADLGDEVSDDTHAVPGVQQVSFGAPPSLLRRTVRFTDEHDAGSTDPVGIEIEQPAGSGASTTIWLILSAIVGVTCVLLGIGLSQLFNPIGPNEGIAGSADADAGMDHELTTITRPSAAATRAMPRSNPGAVTPKRLPIIDQTKVTWHEPEDTEVSPFDSAIPDAESRARTTQLPEWARSTVPEKIDGPFVVVRRVSESSDPSTLPTLGMALDRNKGGTVELADEGPLFVDDLRLPGDSRLIRARPGYRPIIRIGEPSLKAVRDQPGAFTLDHENLILDGIDLIVSARDPLSTRPIDPTASPRQPALFSCNGANLTLRNCSITILNPASGTPFTFVRADSSASRPTRILLERTLVRGGFTTGIDVSGASADVVLHQSVMLGASGPLIRFTGTDKTSERRLYLIDSILSGPGPIIERSISTLGNRSKPLSIRAFGTAFGRLQGAGIASVISSPNATSGADKLIDWNGNDNLFAGWKGFFACGKDLTVTVADLAAVRSTWSATEQGSQEFLSPWPLTQYVASALPRDLAPFLPSQLAILRPGAWTRAGLFEKTLDEYPTPMIPRPVGWAVDRQAPPNPNNRGRKRAVAIRPLNEQTPTAAPLAQGNARSPADQTAIGSVVELAFDTGSAPWNGDLGAFLRDRLGEGTRRARVRVTGNGSHYFTAVRLPDGIWLELVVTPVVGGQSPSWSPRPQSSGTALIVLNKGALVLSNFTFRSEESAHYDQLIHVQDGHLIVSQSELIGRKSAGGSVGDLIGFRAATTERISNELSQLIFTGLIDRPVCRIVDSTLITDGTALKSEIGRGLIAFDQCAVAAGIAAIDLIPSKVARARFDVDLWFDHCTMTSERTIVRVGAWRGQSAGPDRPCLITTRNCAFLAISDRKPRETVLLRSDADALARGTLFWQGIDDVIDLDLFIAAGEGEAAGNGRPRDVQHQWVDFWGANHIKGVSGPGLRGRGLRVRFRNKLRPGRIEPVDLSLDPDYHPGTNRLTVGATLQRQDSTPSSAAFGRDRVNAPGRAPASSALPY